MKLSKQSISTRIKNEILNIIFRHISSDKCIVFLFGSGAAGEMRRDSDIDVGIICDKKLSYGELANIRNDLEEEVHTLREIDLIDFNSVSDKKFLKYALSEIKVWNKSKESIKLLNNLKAHLHD